MCFHFKYCFVVKCIFVCIYPYTLAGQEDLLAVEQKSQYNLNINILNGDVTKKLNTWSKGTIPYFIDDFSFDKVTRDNIRLYLSQVGSQTNNKLRFSELPRPPDDEKARWVLFINRKGLLECDDYYATKFTAEGVQRVVVGYDCLEDEGLAAAVLAVAGVPPEHNSPNRSLFIIIEEKNILPDKLHLFKMIELEDWPFVNLDYDISSASHYDFYMYSSNGLMTINPKVKPSQRQNGLSPTDLLKLKSIYNYKTEDNLAQDCAKMFHSGPKVNKSGSIKNSHNREELRFVSNRHNIYSVGLKFLTLKISGDEVTESLTTTQKSTSYRSL